MRRLLLTAILLITLSHAHAFNWQDLWVTKDQQAKALMDAGQFTKAQETFNDPAWKATAAFRAGDYKDAAKHYQTLKDKNNNADAWYNLGNTMAHANQLESAIKAYDKALAINPHHQDALHNRKIVEALLKKQNKNQNKQEQNKQEQNKQEQNKQEQNKQEQNKQEQNKQEQNKQEQNKQEQNKQEQNKQEQNKQEQNKQEQNKQEQNKQEQNKTREEKQEKEQWLRLIPDDPGGLMREKFLRDYLSRQKM